MIINTIPATDCTPQTIVIGRRGTYDTMQIAFDLSYLIENYGSGTAVLAVKRSQDSSAYPAVTSQEDDILTWIVSDVDTYYVGSGECQLMWYVDGGLAKTIIYPMVVMRDILATSEDAPDAYQTWVDDLIAEGAETLQNAQDAAQSASDAEAAKDDAVAAKEAAESAKEAAETAVTHYPKIENNYWMVWDSTSQSYVSTGIQAEGEDGYSPEITITSITGGHRVIITDKDHPQGQSFDVMDGQGGGTSNYADLSNKPKINNVELNGNKTAHDLGLAAQSDIPTVPVQSVNGKTGAVNLASGDIAYDESATYQSGSVGAELQNQTRQLSDLDDDKQDAPSTAGTAGQVLALDDNLNPVWADQSGGGGGTSDYTELENKPQINGHTLDGNQSASDLGLGTYSKPASGIPKTDLAAAVQTSLGKADTALQTAPVTSVAGKTGAVTLDAGDAAFSDSATYAAGTVGAALTSQKNAIDQKQDAPQTAGTAGQVLGLDSNLNPAWVDQTGDGGGMNIVNLSGTQITQVGTDNTFYVCGELTELTFTAPSVGITMIRFTSGTTPTVLTVNGVTSWMFDNDPTAASLEANKTYDINVLNGVGVVGWA